MLQVMYNCALSEMQIGDPPYLYNEFRINYGFKSDDAPTFRAIDARYKFLFFLTINPYLLIPLSLFIFWLKAGLWILEVLRSLNRRLLFFLSSSRSLTCWLLFFILERSSADPGWSVGAPFKKLKIVGCVWLNKYTD